MTEDEVSDIIQKLDEKKKKQYRVLLPEYWRTAKTKDEEQELYGCYIAETQTFHVVPDRLRKTSREIRKIGIIWPDGAQPSCQEREEPFLAGVLRNGELTFSVGGIAVEEMEYYALQKDLFSRNTGILESNELAGTHVMIGGVGSGGAHIALLFARSGVPEMTLCDDDIFGHHNVCRHQCGLLDVGKYKTDAVADRLLQINPDLIIHRYRKKIQDMRPDELDELITDHTLLLCCADNRHAAYVCNTIAQRYHIPMIAGGCGERASTGSLFYWKPGMPCYGCIFGEDRGVDYADRQIRSHYYTHETELSKADFSPGMAIDVEELNLKAAKLAIDLLMEHKEGYVPRLLGHIGQYTVFCNYLVDEETNPYMKYFDKPLTWRTGSVVRREDCTMCKDWMPQ